MADSATGLYSNEGETYYHFVKNGVDFITLDNADETSFSSFQVSWLMRVLALDAVNDDIRTIIVGMHQVLPYSTSRGHAMDATCQGLCSGQQVYDLLYRAQNLTGPVEKRKHVYVFASHSHTFLSNVFDTPEHQGQVLPGWIIGTAGAEQYRSEIHYGYLEVEVLADGTISPRFREVTRESPPLATGPGAGTLTDFCFEANKRETHDPPPKKDCVCGSAGAR
jgi:hypothetical protein